MDNTTNLGSALTTIEKDVKADFASAMTIDELDSINDPVTSSEKISVEKEDSEIFSAACSLVFLSKKKSVV